MTETSSPTRADGLRESSELLPEEEDEDNLLGVTLHDTYVIQRVIGEGGMGRVYEAHHTRIQGKRFAIKVLRSEMMYSPEIRVRFQREADAAASINHVNVVGVHDFGYAPDGRPYLVSDFLTGVELNKHVEQSGRLSMATSVHIARQICQGLEAAHGKGVIHRDLKPENIFLLGPLDRPLVKVLDFGLSRFMDPPEGSTVTRSGVVMGTPSYMAPEQARGERVDHRVDVYGVGVILYVSLTGHPPFEEESPQQTVLAVMSREPTRPRVHTPSIPDELEIIVQKAMARTAEERFPSLADLDAALAVLEAPTPESARRLPLPSRRGDEETLVSPARSQVVLYAPLGIVMLLFGLITSLAGIPELVGTRRLSGGEFALAITAVVGTLLTPLLLLLRWVRRRLWNNSLRMAELAIRIRSPLVTAVAVYGLAVLTGRTLDTLALEFQFPKLAVGLSGWAGWGPILFGVSLVGALAASLRQRLLAPGPSLFRRVVAGPLVLTAALVAAIGMTQFAVRAQKATQTTTEYLARTRELVAKLPSLTPEREVPATEMPISSGDPALPAPEAPAPSATPTLATPEVPSTPPSSAPVQPSVPTAPADKASSQELSEASVRGSDALLSLSKRYPEDPAVFKALAADLVTHPERQSDALGAIDRLFELQPSEARDKRLSDFVVKAALGAPTGSTTALDIMARRMGHFGGDLLFDLMLSNLSVRAAARERLDALAARSAWSPELAIAFQLRTAATCSARLPLLSRAIVSGDVRSVTELGRLYSPQVVKGCGARRKPPCLPACPAEATQFKRAAQAIQNRLALKR